MTRFSPRLTIVLIHQFLNGHGFIADVCLAHQNYFILEFRDAPFDNSGKNCFRFAFFSGFGGGNFEFRAQYFGRDVFFFEYCGEPKRQFAGQFHEQKCGMYLSGRQNRFRCLLPPSHPRGPASGSTAQRRLQKHCGRRVWRPWPGLFPAENQQPFYSRHRHFPVLFCSPEMPAPVASRSCLIISVDNFHLYPSIVYHESKFPVLHAIRVSSSAGQRSLSVRPLSFARVAAPSRSLSSISVSSSNRRSTGCSEHGSAFICIRRFLPIFILAHGFAFDSGIGNFANQQFDGADGVIIGGDHIINAAWIAVGIHQGDDGNILNIGFMYGGFFTADIHHKDQIGQVSSYCGHRSSG